MQATCFGLSLRRGMLEPCCFGVRSGLLRLRLAQRRVERVAADLSSGASSE